MDSIQPPKICPLNVALPCKSSKPKFLCLFLGTPIWDSSNDFLSSYQYSLGCISLIVPVRINSSKYLLVYGSISLSSSQISGRKA